MGRSGYNPKDRFFHKAKEQNFAARSIFKLEEIDIKYKLFKRHQVILDLGCAPGSWSQYASRKIGSEGLLMGVDLTPIEEKWKKDCPNCIFIQGDILKIDFEQLLEEEFKSVDGFDIVMSDMAPKTTGIKITDQARSMELCEMAIRIANVNLKKGGHFICKLFHSDEFEELKKKIKSEYGVFHAIKPEATRKMSKEIFLLGLQKK